DRIDRLYLYERVWAYDKFEKFYLNHGLVSFIAKKLIWSFKKDLKEGTGLRIEDKWMDAHGNELSWIDNQTDVRLWHPIYSVIDDVLAWRNRLEILQIQQGLKQAYREVYILTDAELNTKS